MMPMRSPSSVVARTEQPEHSGRPHLGCSQPKGVSVIQRIVILLSSPRLAFGQLKAREEARSGPACPRSKERPPRFKDSSYALKMSLQHKV